MVQRCGQGEGIAAIGRDGQREDVRGAGRAGDHQVAVNLRDRRQHRHPAGGQAGVLRRTAGHQGDGLDQAEIVAGRIGVGRGRVRIGIRDRAPVDIEDVQRERGQLGALRHLEQRVRRRLVRVGRNVGDGFRNLRLRHHHLVRRRRRIDREAQRRRGLVAVRVLDRIGERVHHADRGIGIRRIAVRAVGVQRQGTELALDRGRVGRIDRVAVGRHIDRGHADHRRPRIVAGADGAVRSDLVIVDHVPGGGLAGGHRARIVVHGGRHVIDHPDGQRGAGRVARRHAVLTREVLDGVGEHAIDGVGAATVGVIQRAVQGEGVVAGIRPGGLDGQDPQGCAAAGHDRAGDLQAGRGRRGGRRAQRAVLGDRHRDNRRIGRAVAAEIVVFQHIAADRHRDEVGGVVDIAQRLVDDGAVRIGLRPVGLCHRHIVQRDGQHRGVGVALGIGDGVGEPVRDPVGNVGIGGVAVGAVGVQRQRAVLTVDREAGRAHVDRIARLVDGHNARHRRARIIPAVDRTIGPDLVVVQDRAGDRLPFIHAGEVVRGGRHIVIHPDGQDGAGGVARIVRVLNGVGELARDAVHALDRRMVEGVVQGEGVVAGIRPCGFDGQDPERFAIAGHGGAGDHQTGRGRRRGRRTQRAVLGDRHFGDRRIAPAIAAEIVVVQHVAADRHRVEGVAVVDIAQRFVDDRAFRIGVRIVVFGHRHVVQRDRQRRGVGIAFRVRDRVGEHVRGIVGRDRVGGIAVGTVGVQRQRAELSVDGEGVAGLRRLVGRQVVRGHAGDRSTRIVAGADGTVGPDLVVVHDIAGDRLADIHGIRIVHRGRDVVHHPDGQHGAVRVAVAVLHRVGEATLNTVGARNRRMVERTVQHEAVVASRGARRLDRQDPQRLAAWHRRGAGNDDLRAVGGLGAVAQRAAALRRDRQDGRIAEAVGTRVVVVQHIAGHRDRIEVRAVVDIAQRLVDDGVLRRGFRVVVLRLGDVVQIDRQDRGRGITVRIGDRVGELLHGVGADRPGHLIAVRPVGVQRQRAEFTGNGEGVAGLHRRVAGLVDRGHGRDRRARIGAGTDGTVGPDLVVVHDIAGDRAAFIHRVGVVDGRGHIVVHPDGQRGAVGVRRVAGVLDRIGEHAVDGVDPRPGRMVQRAVQREGVVAGGVARGGDL